MVSRVSVYIKNFVKYKGLLEELVLRDIKVKYKRSVLGILWSLLNPIFIMLIINIVFSSLFRFDIKNFPLYLLTGQILFNFMAEATNLSMASITQNSSLIRKVYIPKYIFPLSKTMFSFVNLLFSLIAILIFLFPSGIKPSWTMILFPISLGYVFLFALGLGLILSAYAVFFRDIMHLYGVLIVAWTYLTPIFYPVNIIPEEYSFLIKLNPMYYYIEHFRQVLLYSTVPSFSLNAICMAFSIGFLVVGVFAFYKNQDRFIYYL